MEINPNSRITWSAPLVPVTATRSPLDLESDRAEFDQIAKLKKASKETPDLRPEVVARARTLLSDVNYPPMETIQKIGELLAVHFSDSTESSNLNES